MKSIIATLDKMNKAELTPELAKVFLAFSTNWSGTFLVFSDWLSQTSNKQLVEIDIFHILFEDNKSNRQNNNIEQIYFDLTAIARALGDQELVNRIVFDSNQTEILDDFYNLESIKYVYELILRIRKRVAHYCLYGVEQQTNWIQNWTNWVFSKYKD
jgi:hypothetical protein